MVINHH